MFVHLEVGYDFMYLAKGIRIVELHVWSVPIPVQFSSRSRVTINLNLNLA